MTAPTPDRFYGVEPIDLRGLLGSVGSGDGIAIGFEMSEAVGVLIVDRISGMATLAEGEFIALPKVFGFGRGLFDAACRREIEGGHPLRLRLEPKLSADQSWLGPL